jgi:hypothetical protein
MYITSSYNGSSVVYDLLILHNTGLKQPKPTNEAVIKALDLTEF